MGARFDRSAHYVQFEESAEYASAVTGCVLGQLLPGRQAD
jgi:hypothetical protein